jgi:hypothetical protein
MNEISVSVVGKDGYLSKEQYMQDIMRSKEIARTVYSMRDVEKRDWPWIKRYLDLLVEFSYINGYEKFILFMNNGLDIQI